MLTGPTVILILKIAVSLTTLLLLASLLALALRRPRLHGQLNTLVTVLLFVAVLGFEVVLRLAGVDVTSHMDAAARYALNVHLCFSVPLLPALVAMLVTGRKGRVRLHLGLAVIFVVLWVGMFVTGVFYLPHVAMG
jgi:hypothetical protein